MSPPVFPTPVFEGSEKRLCALFAVPPGSSGLRALPRSDLDALMTEAECQIVSARHHGSHDAYVLSESSLFVYADRLVLKTCGTTRLLSCLGPLLALVEGRGLRLRWLKFSRASYLFPERQPHPHSSFEAECELLDGVLDGRFSNSTRHVLGAEEGSEEGSGRLRWHVYVAGEAEEEEAGSERECSSSDEVVPSSSDEAAPSSSDEAAPSSSDEAVLPSSDKALPSSSASDPIHTAEIIMTDLCGRAASSFFRGDDFVSAEHTTRASGVGAILPRASVDDYVFEPCGYSMNAALDAAFATSHITPEQGFSYASYEVCGRGFFPREERLVSGGAYSQECTSVPALLHRCAAVFRPRQLALAVSVDAPDALVGAEEHVHRDWAALAPVAYNLAAAESAVLPSGSRVSFVVFEAQAGLGGRGSLQSQQPCVEDQSLGAATPDPVPPLKALSAPQPCESEDAGSGQGSPRTVMGALAASVCTDLDVLGGGRAGSVSEGEGSGEGLKGPSCGPAVSCEALSELISRHSPEDLFYAVRLERVRSQMEAWRRLLPGVEPMYAVKSFPNARVVEALVALGAGFDCASEAEVELALAAGAAPERIILANPCKRARDLRCARARSVPLATYDSLAELAKVAAQAPDLQLLLRVQADCEGARCPLGNKYGAQAAEWEPLLLEALRLGVPVVGVAFHVGSGVEEAEAARAFEAAIRVARAAWDLGASLGLAFHTLDLGGGFAGSRPLSPVVAAAVEVALARHFPPRPDEPLRVLAEPGRYFAEQAATLVAQINGKRERRGVTQYYIGDGLYGGLNCVLYDHASPKARPLRVASRAAEQAEAAYAPATVFGPTCDGLDTVLEEHPLPGDLVPGDWLVFDNMGAYTHCGATAFNGIDAVNVPIFYL